MMVADSETVRRLSFGRDRNRTLWVGVMAQAAVILAAICIGIAILYVAEIISGVRVLATVVAIAALAGLIGVAAIAAHWVQGGLAGRVDILSQALEASPDAQLIVAPDGRVAYANTAFNNLLPPMMARCSTVSPAPSPAPRRAPISSACAARRWPAGAPSPRCRCATRAASPPAGSTSPSTRSPAGPATASGTSRTSPPATRWRR